VSRLLTSIRGSESKLGDSLSFFETPQPEVETSIEQAWRRATNGSRCKSRFARRENEKKGRQRVAAAFLKYSGNWANWERSLRVIPTYSYAGR